LRDLVQAQWHGVVQALVPAVQKLLDDDRSAGRAGAHRVRVGLYGYSAPSADAPSGTGAPRIRRAGATKAAKTKTGEAHDD